MAKKDTFIALVNRGIDEELASAFAETGLKLGDARKLKIEDISELVPDEKRAAEVLKKIKSAPLKRKKLIKPAAPIRLKQDSAVHARKKRKQAEVVEQEERRKRHLAKMTEFRDIKKRMLDWLKTMDEETREDNESRWAWVLNDANERVEEMEDNLQTMGIWVDYEPGKPPAHIPVSRVEIEEEDVDDFIYIPKEDEVSHVEDDIAPVMQIKAWIDELISENGSIRSQTDRDDFIRRTGAGATKFNKWMRRYGLVFDKKMGRWYRPEDVPKSRARRSNQPD